MLVLNTQAAQRQNIVLASTQDARSAGSPGNVRRQAQASVQGNAERTSTLRHPATAAAYAQEEKEIRAPRREDLDKKSARSNLYLPGPVNFEKQQLTGYDDEAGKRADEMLGRVFNVDFLRSTHEFESGRHGYNAVGELQDGYSALGMYQFRAPAFLATGYLRRLGDGQLQWTGKNGINSAQDFLSAPDVQEIAMREYTIVRENEVLAKGTPKFIGTDINWGDRTINITMAGLMGTSHYLGAGGSNSFINTLKEFDFDADRFLNSLPDDKKRKHYEDALRRLREFQNIPVSKPK